jgi:membrane fusion protein
VLLKLSGLDQSLLLQLLVPASAAGFIQTEQNVRVRLDAFPHQKYGTLNATVSKVASTITLPNESQAHAVPLQQPVFLVQAELERSYIYAKGNPISLKEGMTVQADVVLSERSLLEWLLSPLYSLKGNL